MLISFVALNFTTEIHDSSRFCTSKMWFKLLTALCFILLGDPWPWLRTFPPPPASQYVLAFEMDDSNETLAEQFQQLTSDIDVRQEIEEQIRKSFKKPDPFADAEIDLASADSKETAFSSKVTTTHLPLQPTTDEYRQEGLSKVNEYRKQHCVPPLTMNSWLNLQADTYAQHALANQAFIPQVASTKLGENLYIKKYPHGSGSSSGGASNPSSVVLNAIENWYRERYDYDFQNPIPTSHYGKAVNFTNLIWKSTQNVGLGHAFNDEELIVVALFYPPAFWSDSTALRQNVLPTEAEKNGDGGHSGGGGSGLPEETFMKMIEHSNLYF